MLAQGTNNNPNVMNFGGDNTSIPGIFFFNINKFLNQLFKSEI